MNHQDNDPQFLAKFFPHVAENHISVSRLGSTDSFEEIHGSFLLTLKNERDTIVPCRYFEVPMNEPINSNSRNTFWLSNSEMMGLILGITERILLNSKDISDFESVNQFIEI